MRYAIISKGLTANELIIEANKAGAKNIKGTKLLGQVFCELTEGQVNTLAKVPGLAIKPLKQVRLDVVMVPERVAPQALVGDVQGVFATIRSLFTPPITGQGLTVAVLDSGIRKTHESLEGKVVYEENFSSSSSVDDVYGHGSQVAFVIAGGAHGNELAGVSPGASLMNIKVINDEGIATEEEIVLGIERVCELVMEALEGDLWYTDRLWPNVINLSLGAEVDDVVDDEDSPMRVACRTASTEYGLDVVAAAGNYGPEMTTITIPGTEPEVITVGAIETVHKIQVWEKSSRGPTKSGDVKPDFVFWGVGIEAASHEDDTDYIVKSGTSFSTPMLSGLTGLLWETGRRVYGGNWRFRWTEARQLAPYYCLKPEGALAKKGNTYGYGLPAVGTMIGRLATPKPAVDVETMITPMMLIMMIVSMMKIMV